MYISSIDHSEQLMTRELESFVPKTTGPNCATNSARQAETADGVPERPTFELPFTIVLHHRPAGYFDTYERRPNERIDTAMSKDFCFACQREYRFLFAGFGETSDRCPISRARLAS